MSHPVGVVASHALVALVDGPRQPLRILHRGRLSWQLADVRGQVVCCVTFPGALRLPHALAVDAPLDPTSPLEVGAGAMVSGATRLTVTRWWQPPQPQWPRLRAHVHEPTARQAVGTWRGRLGHGRGLTPYADDVLLGSLVTLIAAGHPLAARWSADVASAPLEDLTTAASAGLLRQATRGLCLDQLAAVLAARANGEEHAVRDAEQALLAVGSSSGAGLLAGVRQLLGQTTSTPAGKGVAA
ncbi:MAG: DUF2877 domain-containing protein [Nocardioidaceae bacterium]|nr:DUF2877 domain-containing protein [Nocardioidaceae bacterium]